MKLRGVLARAFNNIICLRGFAPLGDLEKMSFPDENYQRSEIESHSKEIAGFLDGGEYTFFPEIILGGSLAGMGFSTEDIKTLYSAIDKGDAFKLKSVGEISVSTFVKRFKNLWEFDFYATGSFYKLKPKSFSRIDGNHRLQAVSHSSERISQYLAPFCLVLFRDDEERKRFGRVFFHMINFRAIPISEEKNLELILDQDDFDLDRLLQPPFGPEFYLARKCLRNDTFQKSHISKLSHEKLVDLFRYLRNRSFCLDEQKKRNCVTTWRLNAETTEGSNKFFLAFMDKVIMVDELLSSHIRLAEMCMMNKDILASLLVVLLCMKDDYSEYVAWLLAHGQEGNDELLSNGPLDWIVNSFKTGRDRGSRRIFVSMQFGSCGTEQNFSTIQTVVNEINKDYELDPPLEIVRVDQLVTGKTFEINERIINQVSQCGYLIADLTYCNSNVYHEIGMLMGRTLALTHEHKYNMTLILDTQVSEENKIVKFNLKSLQYLPFATQKQLHDEIRKRLEKFYDL